jgi:hypothetical protein
VPYCIRVWSLKVRFMSIGIAIGIAILLNQEYRRRYIDIADTFMRKYRYRYRQYFFRLYRYRLSAILLLSIVNNPDLGASSQNQQDVK